MRNTAEEIYKKSLDTLEFYKILEALSEFCLSDEAKRMAKELLPSKNIEDARRELSKTDEAKVMIERRGTPAFGSISDVNASLKRAKVGSALSPAELLRIGGLLTTTRKLVGYYNNFESDDRILSSHFKMLEMVPLLEKRISESILSPEELADNASPMLFDIRRRSKTSRKSARYPAGYNPLAEISEVFAGAYNHCAKRAFRCTCKS